MISELIRIFKKYNQDERDETLLLERLMVRAEGVGAITYGDDTSHGTTNGDQLEKRTISLAEAREKITKRRRERFQMRADTADWLFENLSAQEAWIMKLYCIESLSTRQISENTGMSVGWVNEVINKSKRKLLRSGACER